MSEVFREILKQFTKLGASFENYRSDIIRTLYAFLVLSSESEI